MNRREGMRRLGFLLGIAGALVGCVYAANEIKAIRASYKFKALAESYPVKNEAAQYVSDINAARTAYLKKDQEIIAEMQQVAVQIKHGQSNGSQHLYRNHRGPSFHNEGNSEHLSEYDAAQAYVSDSEIKRELELDWFEQERKIGKQHSEFNRSAIKRIQWSQGYAQNLIDPNVPWSPHLEVLSIETTNGETLNPTSAPTFWAFAFVILAPAIGFAFPWGIVRGVEWVLAGFSPSRQDIG